MRNKTKNKQKINKMGYRFDLERIKKADYQKLKDKKFEKQKPKNLGNYLNSIEGLIIDNTEHIARLDKRAYLLDILEDDLLLAPFFKDKELQKAVTVDMTLNIIGKKGFEQILKSIRLKALEVVKYNFNHLSSVCNKSGEEELTPEEINSLFNIKDYLLNKKFTLLCMGEDFESDKYLKDQCFCNEFKFFELLIEYKKFDWDNYELVFCGG